MTDFFLWAFVGAVMLLILFAFYAGSTGHE
jgi:hypothetical protein